MSTLDVAHLLLATLVTSSLDNSAASTGRACPRRVAIVLVVAGRGSLERLGAGARGARDVRKGPVPWPTISGSLRRHGQHF